MKYLASWLSRSVGSVLIAVLAGVDFADAQSFPMYPDAKSIAIIRDAKGVSADSQELSKIILEVNGIEFTTEAEFVDDEFGGRSPGVVCIDLRDKINAYALPDRTQSEFHAECSNIAGDAVSLDVQANPSVYEWPSAERNEIETFAMKKARKVWVLLQLNTDRNQKVHIP